VKLNLPTVLSFTGGYVDTAGFLALNGLFTAHVTGNFVMIGAAVANGSSGIIAKLLALPVFCVAVLVVRFAMLQLPMTPRRSSLSMLIFKFLFLTVGAIAAIHFGSFSDADGWPLILTGMLLVIAMAIQNAAHRIHLSSAPPSTLMTGTTTQIMIEVANLLYGTPTKSGDSIRARLVRLVIAVCAFALGCGFAALFYIQFGMWCFVVPPLLAVLALSTLVLEKEYA
jgi:uncharacterized membrane protein YoaK (UPF0700 family)